MDVRVVASGLAFPEGPAIDRRGRLVVTEIGGQRISLVHDDGRVESYAETGGGPNGCAFAADGSLWVCNNGGSWPRVPSTANSGRPIDGPGVLQKVNLDGSIVTALSEIDGRPLNAPNDCVVDAHGGVWFTDPAGGGGPGDVCYLGADGVAVRAWSALQFPNGAMITPNGRTLIVGETFGNRLSAFNINPDGELGPRRDWAVFGALPPLGDLAAVLPQLKVAPDGAALDAEGAVWLADAIGQRVLRVAEGGGVLQEISTAPMGAYACALGGPGRNTLFVCVAPDFDQHRRSAAREAAVWSVPVAVPGAGTP